MGKAKKQNLNGTQGMIPELRFPEFEGDGEWVEKVFQDVFDRLTSKNSENNQNVLTISAQMGLVSQLQYFNKKVSARDVTGYYILQKGDFAYNKSYSKGYPMGAIKPLKFYDKGVVSTLYICFRAKDSYNPSFFEQYFDAGLLNSEIANIAQEGGRAHGLLNVSIKEFFKEINLLVPTPQEQQKIAACLSSLDELMAAHKEKLDALKDHKKGLLQNLFPDPAASSGGEVVPKVRFPEFEGDGEWVEKKLGDEEVSNFVNDKVGSEILTLNNYISTDNMLPDYSGISKASKLPTTSRVTEFLEGDILISNIRPYLKKVWKSDKNGGASNDVLVFRSGSNVLSGFLEFILKNDAFINYVMLSAKGVKMPRGDKDSMMQYSICIPSKKEQQKIASCLSAVDELITAQQEKIEELQQHKK